jgi:hypothetical protein
LRGIVDSWTVACAIEGVCSECGLAFRWRDVLHPGYGIPPWCVEARRSPVAWPVQVVGTLVRAAHPHRFWPSIALHQPIRWLRLMALVLSLAVAMLVLLDIATAAIVVADHRDVQTRGATSTARGGTRPVVGLPARNYWRGLWLERWPIIVGILATPLTTAIAFGALPVTRRRARVRPQHIARIALYGSVVPLAALLVAVVASTWSAVLHPPIVRPNALHVAAMLLLVVATLTWWYAAVRDYLRVERALAVSASASSIGLLLPLAAVAAAWYLRAWG